MTSNKHNPSDKFDIDLSPLKHFARQMDTFFNQSFKQMNSIFHFRPFWTDFQETDDHYIVTAELPGIERDQISIEVLGNQLRIIVDNKSIVEEQNEQEQIYRRHQSEQFLSRTITLPVEIPEDETKAAFSNGLLRFTIPKPYVKPKYIDIEE